MSILSERQKDDLNKSIAEYLYAQDLTEIADSLCARLSLDYKSEPNSKYAGLLEKKWVSVIRLQKKLIESENRYTALQEDIAAGPARRRDAQVDWLPTAPARYTLTSHRAPITRVAFHPTFSLLASASEDTTVKIWDWETGSFERTLKGHTREVWGVDFDSKGSFLATCSSDLSIKVWDTQQWDNAGYSGKTLRGHEHTVSTVKFLPGDDLIASASRDKTIRIWEVATTFCIRTITGHEDWVRMTVPSTDGTLLGSCSSDNTARVWDPTSGVMKMEFRGHGHIVEVIAFAPLASYAAIRELAGLKAATKAPGAYIATGSRDKTVKIWDVHSGQELRTVSGHNDWIRGLVFHPSGKHLLSASDDKTIRVWELSTGRCMKVVEAHSHFITCLAWGPPVQAGGDIKAASGSGNLRGTGADTERRMNVLATGSVDQTVCVWLP